METSTHDFTCRIGVIGAAFRAASGVLLLTLLACGQDDVTDKGRRLDGPNPLATATPTAPPTATPTPPRHPDTIHVRITAGPENGSFSNDLSPAFDYKFDSTPTGTFECRFGLKDSTPGWATCGQSYTAETPVCGEYTFSVRGVVDDTRGNPVSRSWTVDHVAPEIADDSLTCVRNAQNDLMFFDWECTEHECEYECKLAQTYPEEDEGDWITCEPDTTYQGTSEAFYEFCVYAEDPAGNKGTSKCCSL